MTSGVTEDDEGPKCPIPEEYSALLHLQVSCRIAAIDLVPDLYAPVREDDLGILAFLKSDKIPGHA